MSARLVVVDEPGAWIEFESRGREYRARMDPMWLGPEKLSRLLNQPPLVWQLLDERDRLRAMTSDPFGQHIVTLLKDYLDAVGLGFEGLARLGHALDNLDLVEVDLLRLGLDIRDWLDPEGTLSSRRMSLVVKDLQGRPETNLGAKVANLRPLSKGDILLAQFVGGAKEGEPHRFLKSPSDLEAEHRAQAERDAAQARIKERGF